jgi:Na+/H+-dicarboxylate symporter/ABC-type amino acid transport substrate-binding protein
MTGSPRPAHDRLFQYILWGLALGAAVGLFLGDAAQPLDIVANGFVRLLQVNVLPYLLGSLMVSLGSHRPSELGSLARNGLACLALVWGAMFGLVLLCPLALPPFEGEAVFGLTEPPPAIDWLDLYIPANPFHALANNLIPAVVLFAILAGVALGQMGGERKQTLLATLEAFNEAMARVSGIILRLTPIGLFAIAASTMGQIRLDDLIRLQVWFHFYIGVTLLATFWLLPGLVATLTTVPFGRFLRAMRNALVTAAAAGDALVVLPLIVEAAKELFAESGSPRPEAEHAVAVTVPLVYNFPHAGKVLSLSFLPFSAWFSGSALTSNQFALLGSAGLLSLFGSMNGTVTFLLDLLHLPADLFELFTVSGVVNSHFGAMTAAMHAASISVIVGAATLGLLRVNARRLVRFGVLTAALSVAFVGGTRALYTWLLPPAPSGLSALSSFRLRPPTAPIAGGSAQALSARPVPGNRLQDIMDRGLMRVGYFPDAVPWAFANADGELVGYDVEAAHRLATELGVSVEFVRADRSSLSDDLASGRFDILMSGLTATVGRAGRMELSNAYGSEHVGFLVPDHLRTRFGSLETLDGGHGLVITVPPVEGSREFITSLLPAATIRPFNAIDEALASGVDAVLMPIERAYYWSRVRPEFAAVRPQELNVAVITAYAMPDGELELRNLVDVWIDTRRASGELDNAYDYWIRGRALVSQAPRWSVISNILGWR